MFEFKIKRLSIFDSFNKKQSIHMYICFIASMKRIEVVTYLT